MNTEEICENLQSKERRPKILALEDLFRYCSDKHTSAELLSVFDECYLHILKCYSDNYESVRDYAVQTVTQFIESLPANDFHLLNVIATLMERMGKVETVEYSEEIRLNYTKQLHTLVKHYVNIGSAQSLVESYADIGKILVRAIRDSYPAVQREAAACVISLAKSAETFAFQTVSEQLAKALYTMLNHKHSMARVVAVEALSQIALHINPKDDALSRLLMEVSPLLMDNMPLVRREVGEMGILLLLELKDRYSFFDRLIPFVLCCLKDDSPEVVEYIRPLWVKCGKLYYDENETELNKQELGELLPKNYPKGVHRPTIGCRGLAQRSLRLLKLITRESSDWKVNVRLHSLKLLYQFVLHAEAAMTAKFFEIYPDVARACRDSEKDVAIEAIKAADLMGRLLSYEDWYKHGYDGLKKNANEGYLKCFYYMFTASVDCVFEDMLSVSKLLVKPEFSHSLKPVFHFYVLKLVVTLLAKCETFKQEGKSIESALENLDLEGDSNEELNRNLYVITVKVVALSTESQHENAVAVHENGRSILNSLAEREQVTVAALHEKYFAAALEHVDNLDAHLDANSEPVLLLCGLIGICELRASYLVPLQEKIQVVWNHCASDAQVQTFTVISVAMLQWHDNIGRDLEESTRLLQEFISAVVEQHLLWHAGSTAEAMRALATATLCSASQGAPDEARQVLPTLAKYMSSLLEDNSVTTRHYAVKCMNNFGMLKIDDLKQIAYGVLQRLDDPSSGIRESAALTIPKLCPKFEQENAEHKFERDIWESFIKKAMEMLFLHYEGPERRVQAAVKVSILELAQKYPEIFKNCYKKAVSNSSNIKRLQELEIQLPFVI